MAVEGLQIGEPAPWFFCAASNNPAFHFDTVAGRYVVLSFLGSAGDATSAAALTDVRGPLRAFFDDTKVSFFGVSIDPADRDTGRLRQLTPGIRFFWDVDRAVSRLYGAIAASAGPDEVMYRRFTLVLDPSLRLLRCIPLRDAATHTEALRRALDALPPLADHAGTELSAPVLIVPRVLAPDTCNRLIEIYRRDGGAESGFMREEGGRTVGIVDYGFKRRRDVYLEEPVVRAAIRTRIEQTLLPEIAKAFQFHVTQIERYVVACYDGSDGGFFRPHRDNTTKGTAHRRFACTINLNTGGYAGGELRFPEFGPRRYVAPLGGAVVFSCSLLHEALPVTRGVRYALLPFLYDQAAADLRRRNLHYLGDEVVDDVA